MPKYSKQKGKLAGMPRKKKKAVKKKKMKLKSSEY